MSKHFSHLNSAVLLVDSYTNEVPFAVAIKQFFKGQKKFGSKDRRAIRTLGYQYFRVANMLASYPDLKEKLIIAHVLCNHEVTSFIENVKPEWVSRVALPQKEKIKAFDLDISTLFPFNEGISSELDSEEFALSHLTQPKVFLRYRKGKRATVHQKLFNASIAFDEVDEFGVSVPANAQVDKALVLNADAVVQDYGSQQVRTALQKAELTKGFSLFDCCAASGGKSILAKDTIGNFDLTVSDVRGSILKNLINRFKVAGIKGFKSHVLDLSNPAVLDQMPQFDMVMADVPCSGSGTWGRTPERMQQVTKLEIEKFHQLQKSIATNVYGKVKEGGYLLYITCSVYELENQEVIKHLDGEVVYQQLFYGVPHQSDSMYMALIKKNRE